MTRRTNLDRPSVFRCHNYNPLIAFQCNYWLPHPAPHLKVNTHLKRQAKAKSSLCIHFLRHRRLILWIHNQVIICMQATFWTIFLTWRSLQKWNKAVIQSSVHDSPESTLLSLSCQASRLLLSPVVAFPFSWCRLWHLYLHSLSH